MLFGSGVLDDTVAVVLNRPDAVGGVEASIVKEALPGAKVGVVQVTVGATVPGGMELHVHPAGTIAV